jgi:hypothetical protein
MGSWRGEKYPKEKGAVVLSKAILESLVNNYPETPLLEKLNSYIKKINTELNQILNVGHGKIKKFLHFFKNK